MSETRAVTVRLEPTDYQRLVVEAKRLAISPGTLARMYLRIALEADGETAVDRRRRAGLSALDGFAALRERLTDDVSVDAVPFSSTRSPARLRG